MRNAWFHNMPVTYIHTCTHKDTVTYTHTQTYNGLYISLPYQSYSSVLLRSGKILTFYCSY